MSRTFTWRTGKPTRKQRRLLDRLSTGAKVLLALVPIALTALALRHTMVRDADQQGLEGAKVAVDVATKLATEDPELARPIVKVLREGGQPEAAQALDSVVRLIEQRQHLPKPVMMPADPDSAEAQVAAFQQQIDAAPVRPSGVVVRGGSQQLNANVSIEILPIHRDSSAATLESGERVARAAAGTLFRVGAKYHCASSGCFERMQCCRLVVDAP